MRNRIGRVWRDSRWAARFGLLNDRVVKPMVTIDTISLVYRGHGSPRKTGKRSEAFRASGERWRARRDLLVPYAPPRSLPASCHVCAQPAARQSRCPRCSIRSRDRYPFGRKRPRPHWRYTIDGKRRCCIATTLMAGNRRRTTERNSKPDIPGILRSERIMSGISSRSSDKAEKPSAAQANPMAKCPENMRQRHSQSRLIFDNKKIHCGLGHPAPSLAHLSGRLRTSFLLYLPGVCSNLLIF